MTPSAHGNTESTDSLVSTSVADSPVTLNGNGAAVARMSLTSRSPAAECGSMLGTTDTHVPCSPGSGVKRALSAFGGATTIPFFVGR